MSNDVKDVLTDYNHCIAFSHYLKDNKGVDYTAEECCDMIEWFKDSNNDRNLNPTQGVLFDLGRKEAIFFMGEAFQMNRIYELYYALMYGIKGLK